MTRRIVPTVVVVLASMAAVAPAAHAAKRATMPVALPSPGHVTVAVVQVRVKARRPAGLARHFRLGVKRLAALPPSVKVLTVQRFIRSKHGGTYAAGVIVVNRAGAVAGSAGARSAREATFLDLLFEGKDSCRECGTLNGEDDLIDGVCSACREYDEFSKLSQAQNVDLMPSTPKPLAGLLSANFSEHGDTSAIFGDPASGKPPDQSLDTGHYDDGHAFGWNVKSKSDLIQLEHEAIDDIIKSRPEDIIRDFEVASALDLNGNGQIDQPGGSGQQVTTIVGPPVIT